MTSRKRMVLGTIIGVPIALTVIAGIFLTTGRRAAHERLVRLLSQTDHHALLQACRQLAARTQTGELSPGDYWVRWDKEPRLTNLPEAILRVDPLYVHIDSQGYVYLEMAGIPYWGAVAYPGPTKDGYGFQGNVELIPGLWYYDEDCDDRYPRHQAKIHALIQKGREAANAQTAVLESSS